MRNILVVDQDPDFGTLCQFVLGEYHVLTAGSVEQALGCLTEEPVDLVLTEWVFSDGTAQELVEQMPDRAVPVILLSAIPDMWPALPRRVRARIDKPFNLPDLRAQVGHHLADRASRAAASA